MESKEISTSISIEDVQGIVYVLSFEKYPKKFYVGQTLSHHFCDGEWVESGVIKRLNYHIECARQNKKLDLDHPLHLAINKSKITYYHEIIVLSGKSVCELDQYETKIIKALNSVHPNGYNLNATGYSFNKSKKMLHEYYKIPRQTSPGYEARNKRVRQVTIGYNSVSDKIKFLEQFTILKIYVTTINCNKKPSYIRLTFSVVEVDKYIYRVDFNSKSKKSNSLAISYNNAVDMINQLQYEDIEFSPAVKKIMNGEDPMTAYKYQNKLERLDLEDIRDITCTKQFHKGSNNYIYLLLIYYSNNKIPDKLMFGGKNMKPEESLEVAKEFIKKIKENCPNNFSVKYLV